MKHDELKYEEISNALSMSKGRNLHMKNIKALVSGYGEYVASKLIEFRDT
jgi:hypothetical protein